LFYRAKTIRKTMIPLNMYNIEDDEEGQFGNMWNEAVYTGNKKNITKARFA